MIFQHFFNCSCPSYQLSVLRILVVSATITFTFAFAFALAILTILAVIAICAAGGGSIDSFSDACVHSVARTDGR